MTSQCPRCYSYLITKVRDGSWACRICHHFWLNAPCKLELQLLANAMQRHTDAARAEAAAREEAATPMTEQGAMPDVQCRRCGAAIRERAAELCWWCGDYLCVDCWERFGHCGHAGADEHVRLGKLGLLYDCPISWAGYPEAERERLAQEAHARAREREANYG